MEIAISKLCMYYILRDILNLSSNEIVSFILLPSMIETIHFPQLDNSIIYHFNLCKTGEKLYLILMCSYFIIRDANLILWMRIRIKQISYLFVILGSTCRDQRKPIIPSVFEQVNQWRLNWYLRKIINPSTIAKANICSSDTEFYKW